MQFYAITAERKLTHPAVVAITSNARGVLFATAKPVQRGLDRKDRNETEDSIDDGD